MIPEEVVGQDLPVRSTGGMFACEQARRPAKVAAAGTLAREF